MIEKAYMDNKWFDEKGNLKISSEEFYCTVIYSWNTIGNYEIKEEIIDFVKKNYTKYKASSDIVAIYYAVDFAKETKTNYSACTLLCRSSVTSNADWDSLEIRHRAIYDYNVR